MNSSATTLAKYLANYAEADVIAWPLPDLPQIDAICVVPVFDEAPGRLMQMLEVVPQGKHTVFIWVLNAPDSASAQAVENTRACLASWRERLRFVQLAQSLHMASINERCHVFVLDFTLPGELFPAKQGVGLARKKGLDWSLRLCEAQRSAGRPMPCWLHSCDADVSLPRDYFDIPSPEANQVAALYPFEHCAHPGFEVAMALYDFRLEYYEHQLAAAGSPYAFHTIGSIIAVTPLAYAQVRGMPKRSGGEDFYFLNKLAKLGEVQTLKSPCLNIEGRPSMRVPIGTGPAISAIAENARAIEDYVYYHPEIFARLKQVLNAAASMGSAFDAESFWSQLRAADHGGAFETIRNVLLALGVQRFLEHLAKQSHKQAFTTLFSNWFDGFKTLKFVHAMRDEDCPSLNLERLRQESRLLDEALLHRIEALLAKYAIKR